MRAVVGAGLASALALGACLLSTDLAELEDGSASSAAGSDGGSTAPTSSSSGASAHGGAGRGETGGVPMASAGGVAGQQTGGDGGHGGAAGGSSSSNGGSAGDCGNLHELVIDPATGHCYYFDPGAMLGWNAALSLCKSLGPGWDLAAMNSTTEHQLVTAALDPLVAADTWIGGNDLAAEGVYVWSNGDPWSYEDWDSGQPNMQACAGGDEDCVDIDFSRSPPDGDFGDDCCDQAQPFLCERP
jgi:hypothetical protein